MPRLGKKYDIEMETISKPREDYNSNEYLKSGLPQAPAVMVAEEIAVQGADISEEKLETLVRRHLGLPLLEPQY